MNINLLPYQLISAHTRVNSEQQLLINTGLV